MQLLPRHHRRHITGPPDRLCWCGKSWDSGVYHLQQQSSNPTHPLDKQVQTDKYYQQKLVKSIVDQYVAVIHLWAVTFEHNYGCQSALLLQIPRGSVGGSQVRSSSVRTESPSHPTLECPIHDYLNVKERKVKLLHALYYEQDTPSDTPQLETTMQN